MYTNLVDGDMYYLVKLFNRGGIIATGDSDQGS
jgi:hypothetical protein